jgi:hypothetical protein
MLPKPRNIVDLDQTPPSKWCIPTGALFIYLNEAWVHEPVGCILCADSDRKDPQGQTLKRENEAIFCCLTHGNLEQVPYSVERVTKIKIGERVKEVVQTIDQFVLFPQNIDISIKDSILDKLISAIADAESNSEPSIEFDE